MQVGRSISALIFASMLGATSTAACATTFNIAFTISDVDLVANGQVDNVSRSDFPAEGTAVITSVGSGYQITSFVFKAGQYSFPTDFFSTVQTVSQDGKTISSFTLSYASVEYVRNITFDFAAGHFGSFAIAQATPEFSSLGCTSCVMATLESSDLPSTVPLPASAPLFGAALVGLAAIGLRRRSGKTATPV